MIIRESNNDNKPPFRLRFHILISTAGGAGVIIWVYLPSTMISLFSSLLHLRLHLHLNLSCLHVYILRFSLGMHWAWVGGHPGLLCSGLALWALLFLNAEISICGLLGLSIAALTFVLVRALSISCSAVCPLGVPSLWGVSLRGGGGTLCIRAVVTAWGNMTSNYKISISDLALQTIYETQQT